MHQLKRDELLFLAKGLEEAEKQITIKEEADLVSIHIGVCYDILEEDMEIEVDFLENIRLVADLYDVRRINN